MQWITEQRHAYRAGSMSGKGVKRLEALGMVWSAIDLVWEENLAAIQAYVDQTGLRPRPGAP